MQIDRINSKLYIGGQFELELLKRNRSMFKDSKMLGIPLGHGIQGSVSTSSLKTVAKLLSEARAPSAPLTVEMAITTPEKTPTKQPDQTSKR